MSRMIWNEWYNKGMLEKEFQAKVVKYLRSKGCFVWKTQENATTRAGVADIFFCLEGFYGFIECKCNKTARLRPGQKEFIEKMDKWSWARICYPENWEETKKELGGIL